MQRWILVVTALVLPACGSGAAPEDDPVTSVAASTRAETTTVATAATDPGSCEASAPPVTNSRGFYCPPHLPVFSGDPGGPVSARVAAVSRAQPGTYRTHLFAVPSEFTRAESFQTLGEGRHFVQLDGDCPVTANRCREIWLYATEELIDLEAVSRDECFVEHALEDTNLGGYPASFLHLIETDCDIHISGVGLDGEITLSPLTGGGL